MREAGIYIVGLIGTLGIYLGGSALYENARLIKSEICKVLTVAGTSAAIFILTVCVIVALQRK